MAAFPRLLLLYASSLLIGLALGHRLAHRAPAQAALPSADAAATTPASRANDDRRLPPAPNTSTTDSNSPLPAAETPIADAYAQLAVQARAGNAVAARRLADDLQRCAYLPHVLRAAEYSFARNKAEDAEPSTDPAKRDNERSRQLTSAERLLKRYRDDTALCNGIDGRRNEHDEWLYLAARNGDAEAALCYALGPSPWETTLSPQWLDHAERAWRENSQLLHQALEAGIPEAANVLSAMYSPDVMFSSNAWTGRLGNDPRQAYAYALIAERAIAAKPQSSHATRTEELAAALTPQARQSARDWADAQLRRIRFRAPANPRENTSRCTMLRSMGGF